MATDCRVYRAALANATAAYVDGVMTSLLHVTSSADGRIALMAIMLLVTLVLCPALCVDYVLAADRVMAAMRQRTRMMLNTIREIDEEKHRTEKLVHKLLPPAIAKDLMANQEVLAESYESVTIYYSDIVGFTSLSSQSTPMQIATFLDKLYTEFDSRIDLYDVYKVQTIGDAYMIVSGCPRTNGIRHAGEIATLSLDILNMVQNFQIPHLPDKKLMIRIGVHSGPCLAAIVGNKMPRYCLFGPAVNIAMRMESAGQALRIQVSDDCKTLLDRLGKYFFKDRGEIEVKEGVFVKSLWLTGKDGYNFQANVDVCVFIPKKVVLDRVIVKRNASVKSKMRLGVEDAPSLGDRTLSPCDDTV
ncbi:Speract receptor [Lamellibrachia satsuma]|nr:Speract receptor [Lamellibrachia satsuma]